MILRAIATLALAVSTCGCHPTQPAPPAPPATASAATQASDQPQSGAQPMKPPIRKHPPVSSPGWRVPGTTVSLPRTAAAGTTVSGSAPAGSKVEFLGRTLKVGADGRFQIAIPGDASGSLPVRIERPGTTALTLRVEIEQ